jgi:TonB family protein
MIALILAAFLYALAGPAASVPSVSPPAPPAAPAIPAKDNSGTGRFEIRDGTQNTAWLDDRFREALWRNDAVLRELNGQSPRTLEEYLRSNDYSTIKQALNLSGSWKSGNATHTWVFEEPDQPGGLISRALELEDLSGPDGYHVRATVHCYDAPEICDAYRNRQLPLLAPKPAATAGDLALRQWHDRILTEPCTVFARNMRQPAYPTTALRDGIEGVVLVGIAFNSCGNVRDAWVQQSSGSPELDRAAVKQALKWQIDAQSLPKSVFETGRATVPIRFVLDDALATEAAAAPVK